MLMVIRKNISVAFMSIKSLLLVINFIFAFVSNHIINSSAQKLIFVSYTLKKFIKFLSNFKIYFIKSTKTIELESSLLFLLIVCSFFFGAALCGLYYYYLIYQPVLNELILVEQLKNLITTNQNAVNYVQTKLLALNEKLKNVEQEQLVQKYFIDNRYYAGTCIFGLTVVVCAFALVFYYELVSTQH